MIVKRDPNFNKVRDPENEFLIVEYCADYDFQQEILQFVEGEDMAKQYSTRMKNYEQYRTKPFIEADKIFDIVKDTLKSFLLTLTQLRQGYMFNLNILDHVLKMIDQHKTIEEIKNYIVGCLEQQSKMEDDKNDGI